MREAGKPRPGAVASRGRGDRRQGGEHLAGQHHPGHPRHRCGCDHAGGLWGTCRLACTAHTCWVGVLKWN